MRRGQAALEFLSTYGWAILIVLVMIGALSYFGITNPTRYLPDKCIFTTGINCEDYIVQQNAANNLVLRFNLANGLGEAITVTTVNAVYNSQTSSNCVSAPVTVSAGNNQSFTCTTNFQSPGSGQPVKFSVTMAYRPAQGGYDRTVNGEISSKVQ